MIIIFVFIVLLLIIGIIIFVNYTKLKDIRMCIDTCADNINNTLNHKLEMVNSLLEKLDSDTLNKKFTYDEDSSLYDREDSLFIIGFEINKYAKGHKKKKFLDDIRELNILEESLDGLKDFYNTNLLSYNEIFLKKYFNFIFKLLGFKEYKSFKMRKLEEYEIFKN